MPRWSLVHQDLSTRLCTALLLVIQQLRAVIASELLEQSRRFRSCRALPVYTFWLQNVVVWIKDYYFLFCFVFVMFKFLSLQMKIAENIRWIQIFITWFLRIFFEMLNRMEGMIVIPSGKWITAGALNSDASLKISSFFFQFKLKYNFIIFPFLLSVPPMSWTPYFLSNSWPLFYY